MQHRHLNHQRYTLAAIDNIIASGKRQDWADLRQVVLKDPEMLEKVARICSAHIHDPYAQRYHFWMNYAKKHSA
ncbi:MAG TPA: hypothetical protein ENK26_04315 [Gammaproteobacteria bacterium]|nr:hypothetical protein [Gammaproteobacteria bacterium]